ncbi:SMP-30/gluconolactonase/LRE family protein [Mycobacterium sp. BMJ-28]
MLDGFGVTESLRWRDNALYFSDLARGTVHRWDGRGPEATTIVAIPGRAGGFGWDPTGRMIVVSMDGACLYRLEGSGELVRYADLSRHTRGPVNDMLILDDGTAYVGSFGFDYYAHMRSRPTSALFAPPGPPSSSLVFVDIDGTPTTAATGLLFPNGCALVDNGKTLVVAESLRMKLSTFSIGPNGRLEPAPPWASLIAPALWVALTRKGIVGKLTRLVSTLLDHPAIAQRSSSPVSPDGIAVDPNGGIWVANVLRGECVLVARGGEILRRIRTSQYALDCEIGGPDGTTLYIATSPTTDPTAAGAISQGRIEQFDI